MASEKDTLLPKVAAADPGGGSPGLATSRGNGRTSTVLSGVEPVEIDGGDAHVCFVMPMWQPDEVKDLVASSRSCLDKLVLDSSDFDQKMWEKDFKEWLKETGSAIDRLVGVGANAGQRKAKRLFRKPHEFPGDEDLAEFDKCTTFTEYATKFRTSFVEYLQGPQCGFQVQSIYSVDSDEVFLKVKVPTERKPMQFKDGHVKKNGRGLAAADVLAADLGMKLRISTKAFEYANKVLSSNANDDAEPATSQAPLTASQSAPTAPTNVSYQVAKLEPWTGGGVYYPPYADYNLAGISEPDPDEDGTIISPFEPFQDKELIVMVYMAIRQRFKITEMIAQGLLTAHFPLHKVDKIKRLKENWGRLAPTCHPGPDATLTQRLTCGLVPGHGVNEVFDDDIKNYFGEEVGFFFYFLTSYTNHLVTPALMGLFMFLRRYIKDVGTVRGLQTVFAFYMAIWAAWFIQKLIRGEARRVVRWGCRPTDQGRGLLLTLPTFNHLNQSMWIQTAKVDKHSAQEESRMRPLYKWLGTSCHSSTEPEEFNPGWLEVVAWRYLSVAVQIVTLGTIIFNIFVLEGFRAELIKNPKDYTWILGPWSAYASLLGQNTDEDAIDDVKLIGPKIGALLITLQIRIMDTLWDYFARFVVTKENHRLHQEQMDALVARLYTVKLFNQMYPYIYIAFFKEQIEGCVDACIPELQESLAIFFVSNGLIDVLFAALPWVLVTLGIKKEINQGKLKQQKKNNTTADQVYLYTHVQGKLVPAEEILTDMLTFVVQFAFVCSFTIAWPMMPACAFVYNCIMGRLVMIKRLMLQRRCFPQMSEGIGIWKGLLQQSVTIACVVNTAVAAFNFNPFKGWPQTRKLLAFIVLEHAMLLIVVLLRLTNKDTLASQADEYNQANMFTLLDPKNYGTKRDGRHVPVEEDSEKQVRILKSVLPRALLEAECASP